jgi:hypothetical protein
VAGKLHFGGRVDEADKARCVTREDRLGHGLDHARSSAARPRSRSSN